MLSVSAFSSSASLFDLHISAAVLFILVLTGVCRDGGTSLLGDSVQAHRAPLSRRYPEAEQVPVPLPVPRTPAHT